MGEEGEDGGEHLMKGQVETVEEHVVVAVAAGAGAGGVAAEVAGGLDTVEVEVVAV